ncbi:MAG: xanthine dehydrogenase family protein molybdopterin-binding subunit [Verrucomicrobiota bacterium]|jgi:CO/xanthine dehydrogenase Mo-binding subunit|nr:xanthine dehydrogenase family protein molybdopterin-binding subunit [Verrucomicrobiota bacterium]
MKTKSRCNPTRHIGTGMLRVDAADKVRGKTQYLNDRTYPGALHATVVRSPTARGILKSLTLDPAYDWKGVTVATAEDIPGENVMVMHDRSMPLMGAVGAELRYRGEPVAVVAAATAEKSMEAADHVRLDIEQRPALLTLAEAIALFKKSPKKLELLKTQNIEKGDIRRGFAEADEVLEAEYWAGHQEQLYLENQGLIVFPRKDGSIYVEGSIQCPYFPVNELNAALDLPPEKIRVKQTPIGGAFGGKEDYPSMLAGYAALPALKAKKPVKITYERHEDMLFTPKRHPVWVRFKTGFKKDGTLTAIECDYILDGGAYLTISDVVMYRGILHCALAYRCENVLIRGKVARTNSMPNGAFRGFGAPQAIWGLESHIDAIAEKVGKRPDAYRLQIHARPGDRTPTGQLLTEDNGSTHCLDLVLQRSDFAEKFKQASRGKLRKGQNKYYGIGLSFFAHGSAFTGDGEAKFKAKGRVELALLEDGRPGVNIRVSSTEMGQGVHTIFTQIAADGLSLTPERIRFPYADTGMAPNSGPTVASRTTMVVGNVVYRAAQDLRNQIEAFASRRYFKGAAARMRHSKLHAKGFRALPFLRVARDMREELGEVNGAFQFILPDTVQWDQSRFKGDSYPGYSWSANVAEVEIDPLTLELTVTRVFDVIDIGRVINPMTATGQVEGGLTQALGYAVMEKMGTGKNGLFDASRLQTYIVPTALDVPNYDVKFVEYPYPFAPPGAKGLGELPMDGLAPAIANAIETAIGVRLRSLPITPEDLFNAVIPPA